MLECKVKEELSIKESGHIKLREMIEFEKIRIEHLTALIKQYS